MDNSLEGLSKRGVADDHASGMGSGDPLQFLDRRLEGAGRGIHRGQGIPHLAVDLGRHVGRDPAEGVVAGILGPFEDVFLNPSTVDHVLGLLGVEVVFDRRGHDEVTDGCLEGWPLVRRALRSGAPLDLSHRSEAVRVTFDDEGQKPRPLPALMVLSPDQTVLVGRVV